MRAFIVRVCFVVVFFIGLGAIAEKVSLFFQPEEKEIINLAEFQTPGLKVVKLERPQKIVVRRLNIQNPNDCQMKIGPIMPASFEPKVDFGWEEKVSQ